MSKSAQGTLHPSNPSLQNILEEEYRLKILFLSKSAHELKNIFLTISSVIQNKQSNTIAKNDKEQYDLLVSLCDFGLNLILDINTVRALDDKKTENRYANNNSPIQEFCLVELLDFCLKMFRARQQLNHNNPDVVKIISDYSIPSDLKISSINNTRLKQVITNLLSNAYKFTQKGEIRLSCNYTSNNKIRIKISDTGTGISKEDQEKLFQPFQVVQSNQKYNHFGSGLGLCIVKEILQAFGSEIKMKSKVGVGTKFWFDLENDSEMDVIDPKNFITNDLLKMMSDINSGKNDFKLDGAGVVNESLNHLHLLSGNANEEFCGNRRRSQIISVKNTKTTAISNHSNANNNNDQINRKKMHYSKTTNQKPKVEPLHNVEDHNLKDTNKSNKNNLHDCKNTTIIKMKFSRSLSLTTGSAQGTISRSLFKKEANKKFNLFICDDERQTALSTQNLIKKYFKKINKSVLPEIYLVSDGLQCLFQTYQFYLTNNCVNLILMDQNMPFINGNVICSLIKSIRELESTKIFLITSEDGKNICREANGIYTKPLKFGDIEEILKGQTFD